MNNWQADFPVLTNNQQAQQSLCYLDNAATTFMPQPVIDKVMRYMTHCGANPYRGASRMSEQATIDCEASRKSIAYFVGANTNELIFTKGATEGLNLISDLLGLTRRDTVVNTTFEHHANYLPFKMKANLISVAMDEQAQVDLTALEEVLKAQQVTLLSITYVSNVTGVIQPIKEVIALAKKYQTLVCIDAAQAVSHMPINLAELEVDFMVFSGHKMMAMKGVGILYVNQAIHSRLNYARFGGGMVERVTAEEVIFKKMPLGFEPGTPAVESIISLGAASEYLMAIGWSAVKQHHLELKKEFLTMLASSEFELMFPDNDNRVPVFTIKHRAKQIDNSRLARMLSDGFNIMVNDGQQCCGPLYDAFDYQDGLRASAYIYNNRQDIARFFTAIEALSFTY